LHAPIRKPRADGGVKHAVAAGDTVSHSSQEAGKRTHARARDANNMNSHVVERNNLVNRGGPQFADAIERVGAAAARFSPRFRGFHGRRDFASQGLWYHVVWGEFSRDRAVLSFVASLATSRRAAALRE